MILHLWWPFFFKPYSTVLFLDFFLHQFVEVPKNIYFRAQKLIKNKSDVLKLRISTKYSSIKNTILGWTEQNKKKDKC